MEQPPLLTTTDNPFNPFTQWEEWFQLDRTLGYDTPGLLARIAHTGDAFEDSGIEDAMNEIVRYNLSGVHIVVTPDTFQHLLSPSSEKD